MNQKTKPKAITPRQRCDRCHRRYDEDRGDGYCGLCPNCADETEPHDMKCGILTIDWDKRCFTVVGAGGHAGDVLRPQQVLQELRKKRKPGVSKVPFIVWQENADGYAQLCLHDRKSFEEEVRSMN